MEEQYIKETKIIEKSEEEKKEEIIRSILKANSELRIANNNFEYAEKDLIDYYAYQIKAVQAKLDYLIKKAKEKGIIRGELKNKAG